MNLTTIIVEDDELIRTMISAVISKDKQTPIEAEDGETCLKLLEETYPDIIICDLHLPTIQGDEVIREIRKKDPQRNIFILACTGDTSETALQSLLEAGADDYIAKPINPTLLHIRMEVAKNHIKQIRHKKEAQEELKKNEERFRLISENSRDLVCTHTPTGIITYISPSCKKLLGKSQEELIGKTLGEFADYGEPIDLECGEKERTGELEQYREWKLTVNGEEKWMETYTHAIRDNKNGIKEIYSYSRDITQEKAEEKTISILNTVSEENDTLTFLTTLTKEIGTKLDASVAIHIYSTSERKGYVITLEHTSDKEKAAHKELAKVTPNNKEVFQGKNAHGVFHHIPGIEEQETVITQPIPGAYGNPIGKITIIKKTPTNPSERTKAVLKLCANKIGCVLEEHLMR